MNELGNPVQKNRYKAISDWRRRPNRPISVPFIKISTEHFDERGRARSVRTASPVVCQYWLPTAERSYSLRYDVPGEEDLVGRFQPDHFKNDHISRHVTPERSATSIQTFGECLSLLKVDCPTCNSK